MRILYVSFDDLSMRSPWSGHVRSAVAGLAARGHAVRLLAPAEGLPPGRFERLSASATAILRAARDFRPDALCLRGIHHCIAPALAASRAARPLVVEFGGFLEDEVRGRRRRAVIRAAHRFTLARTARVVAASRDLGESLAARYGFPAGRIDVRDLEGAIARAVAGG